MKMEQKQLVIFMLKSERHTNLIELKIEIIITLSDRLS